LTYASFKEEINKEYAKEWNDFLNYSALRYQVWFKGGVIDKKENDEQLSTFIVDISNDSAKQQVQVSVPKRAVPMFVWYGTPSQITGLRTVRIKVPGYPDIVENAVYYKAYYQYASALIDKDTPDLPLHELCNHDFYRLTIKAKTIDDLKFLNGKQLMQHNIEVLDMNDEPSDELQKMCMKNYFYYTIMPKNKDNYVII
jgi:hypothetical protein